MATNTNLKPGYVEESSYRCDAFTILCCIYSCCSYDEFKYGAQMKNVSDKDWLQLEELKEMAELKKFLLRSSYALNTLNNLKPIKNYSKRVLEEIDLNSARRKAFDEPSAREYPSNLCLFSVQACS